MTGSIGQYKVLDRIGSGGLGEVYRARDVGVGRTVALKVVPAAVAFDARQRSDLLREAKAAAAVSHPAVATLFEAGEDGQTVYLAFEYVPGDSLRAVMGDHPLNPRRALDIAIQLADALAEAHRRGVVHGDLKPGNVMVAPTGRVKVLDLGLARWTRGGAARHAAATGRDADHWSDAILTVPYMSPEQVLGGAVDHRTDIFSLGTILYEMLTGSSPFARPAVSETVLHVLQATPPPVTALNPAVTDEIEAIVDRAMAKSLDRRYQSAAALATDLRGAATLVEARAPAAEPVTGDKPWYAGTGAFVILLVGLALVGAAAAWLWQDRLRDLLGRWFPAVPAVGLALARPFPSVRHRRGILPPCPARSGCTVWDEPRPGKGR